MGSNASAAVTSDDALQSLNGAAGESGDAHRGAILSAVSEAWETIPARTLQERLTEYRAAQQRGEVGDGGAVFEAAATNNAEELRRLLSCSQGVDVDRYDSNGQSALHHAVHFGALDCAFIVLSAGWDPGHQDVRGRGPLDCVFRWADLKRHTQDMLGPLQHVLSAMVLLLLLFGAPPEVRSKSLMDIELVPAMLRFWSGVSTYVKLINTWEGREADLLRNWGALEDSASHDPRVGPGILLLRLLLECRMRFRMLVAPGATEAKSWACGVYRCRGLHHGRPLYQRDCGEHWLAWDKGHWQLLQGSPRATSRDHAPRALLVRSASGDLPLLAAAWDGLVVEEAPEDVFTYSKSSFLPRVDMIDPESDDAPFLGLFNQSSGNKVGAVILEESRLFPIYRARLFDIVHVATRPAALAAFRRQVDAARREAKAKVGCSRPRLLFGGGDGTASFALWCLFRALRNTGREGRSLGTLNWSEEDLAMFFPALVPMPLGTGNDFSGVLGWGRSIDPVSDIVRTASWFKSAVCVRRPVRAFDVWGLQPLQPHVLKACEVAGFDEKHTDRCTFKVAGPSVPFLFLSYFSLGYEAFVVSLVELNRTNSRIRNFLEYAKAGYAGLVGAKRRNVDLTGVVVSVPEGPRKGQYFPPSDRPGISSEYANVGCMNINSFSGGTWSARDPARFDDGYIDLFRQRNLFANVLRRGRTYDTEKQPRAIIRVPARLPGVHCQWDGEARFLFSPSKEDVDIEVMRVMSIPVATGPETDTQETPIRSSNGWLYVDAHDSPGLDAAFIPAKSLSECKELCIRHGFGGFCVHQGLAHFRKESPQVLKSRLKAKPDATFYIREESAQDVRFAVVVPKEKASKFWQRLDDWTSGRLAGELNATAEELEICRRRTDTYAMGICSRSQRRYVDFRAADSCGMGDRLPMITHTTCSRCAKSCGPKGCRGCLRPFCKDCFKDHLDTAPGLKWKFHDVRARWYPGSWSTELSLDECFREVDAADTTRPLRIRVFVAGAQVEENVFENGPEACEWLRENAEDQDSQSLTRSCTGMTHLADDVSSVATLPNEEEGSSFWDSQGPTPTCAGGRGSSPKFASASGGGFEDR
mmetsp:Transcript_36965/g.81165  ORF Transcript_36965/g.81165 Transcript_36965/m.81165 type:complete len:1096 (+) Transcript_36965:22-3309(+)